MHTKSQPARLLLPLIALTMMGASQAQSVSKQGAEKWSAAMTRYSAQDFRGACQVLNAMTVKDLRSLEGTAERKPSQLASLIGKEGKFTCQVPKLNAGTQGNEYQGESNLE